MYVTLYPLKQQQQTKKFMLYAGLFFTTGGLYSLFRHTVLEEGFAVGWSVASAGVVLAGLLWLAVATDKILLKDAYFSMTPERIAFRMALLGREYTLPWSELREVRVTDHFVLFGLSNSKSIKMRLGSIQQREVARHVAASVRLAALQKNIPVNGVSAQPHQAAL